MFLSTARARPARPVIALTFLTTAAVALAGCSGASGSAGSSATAAAPAASSATTAAGSASNASTDQATPSTSTTTTAPQSDQSPPAEPNPQAPSDVPSSAPPAHAAPAPARPAAPVAAKQPTSPAPPSAAPHGVRVGGFHESRQCGADPVLQYRTATPGAALPALAIDIDGQTRPIAQGRYVFRAEDRTPSGAPKPYRALADGVAQPVMIDYLAPVGPRCLTDVPGPVFWNVRGPSRGFTVPGDDQVTYQAIIGDVTEPVSDTAGWATVGYGFHPVQGQTMVHLRAVAKPGFELAYPTGWMQYFGAPRAMAAPTPHLLTGGAGTITVHWERPDAAPPSTTYSVVVTDITGGVRGKPVLRQQNEPKLACDVPVSLGRTIEIEVVANADAGAQITRGTTTYTFVG